MIQEFIYCTWMLFYMQFQIINDLFMWYLFPVDRSFVHPLQIKYAFHGIYVDMEMEAWRALAAGLCLDGIMVTCIFSISSILIEREIRRLKNPIDVN